MATKSPPWFRFYSEVLSDRKIQRICFLTRKPKALIIGVWATILSIASDAPDRGKLLISEGMAITLDDISLETGLDLEECKTIIDAFIAANMIHQDSEVFAVTQWDSRQYKSDTSNDRVAKFRDKKREEEGKPPKRPYNKKCNVTVTPPESESEYSSSSITPNILDEIGSLCDEHFFDPNNDPYKTDLVDTIKTYTADKVLWAIKLALSPERANGKPKTWAYVIGILKRDRQRLDNQKSLNSSVTNHMLPTSPKSPPLAGVDMNLLETLQQQSRGV